MDEALKQGSSKASVRRNNRYTDGERAHCLNEFEKSGLSPFRFSQGKPFTWDTFVRWLEKKS